MITSRLLVPLCGKSPLFQRNRKLAALVRAVGASLLTLSVAVAPISAANFIWTGDLLSENWNTSNLIGGVVYNTNWSPDLAPIALIPGAADTVTFTDTAFDFIVDLNGNRTIISASFSGESAYTIKDNKLTLSSGDLTSAGAATHTINSNVGLGAAGTWDIGDTSGIDVNGIISGAFQLTKSGTGTLTLSGNNTYTGNTRIEGGTLLVDDGGAIPDTSPVRILAGATLQVDGVTEQIEGLQNAAGTVSLTTGATLQMAPTTLRTFPGTITGASNTTFEITGGNTQRLDAASPGFLGTTLINGGTIQLNHANALQNSTVDIQVNGGLNVTTNAIDATLGGLTGTGNLSLGSQTLTVDGSSSPSAYSGVISGTGNLTKEGTGALTLSGANTYGGDTTINAGSIVLGNASALQNSTVLVMVNGGLNVNGMDATLGALAGTGTLNLGSQTLTVGDNNATSAYLGIISGLGGLTKEGNGEQWLWAANTYSGTTTINSGKVALNNTHALQNSTVDIQVNNGLNINGFNATLGGLAGGGSLNLGAQTLSLGSNDETTLYSGILSGSGGSLTKEGVGTLTLSGANTYSGGTTINGGTLSLGNSAAAGTGTITVLGSSIDYSDTVDVANMIDLQSNVTLNIDSGSAIQSGAIAETGSSYSVSKTGAGALTLAGNNTYSGGTTINTGTLLLGNQNALGKGSLTINAGATVDLDANTRRVHGDIAVNDGTLNLTGTTLDASGSNSIGTTPGKNITLSGGGALLDATGTALVNLNGANGGGISFNGDNAGALAVSGGAFNLGASATLQARGGDPLGPGTPGQSGSVSFTGGTSTVDGTINLNGQPGNIGTGNIAAGRKGGNVTVSGSATASLSGILNSQGGNGGVDFVGVGQNGGNGGDLLITGGGFTLDDLSATLDLRPGAGGVGSSSTGSDGTAGSVDVSGGTLTLNAGLIDGSGATPSADPINLVAVELNVTETGSLRVNDNMTISDGTVLLSGTTLDASGLTNQPGNALTLSGADAALVATFGGLIDLDGGNGSTGNGKVGGSLNVTDGSFMLGSGATLKAQGGNGSPGNNNGHSGSVLLSGGNSVLDGTLSLQGRNGAASLVVLPGRPGGDVTLSGTATATLSGTINLRGGNGTGAIVSVNGAAGGDLNIEGGTFTMDAAATLNVQGGNGANGGTSGVPGAVNVSGGTLTLDAGLIKASGATPSADPINLVKATLNASGGDVDSTAAMSLVDGGTINLSAGSMTATTLNTNDGNFNFTGGTLSVDTFGGNLTQDGGILAAGNSPGITNVLGNYTLNAGSLDVELDGLNQGFEFDFYDVTGDVTLDGGTLDVSLIDPFTPVLGQSFEIVDVGGSLSGTFSGLPQAALVGNYGGTDLFIDYASGDGNDVSLVATLAGDFDLDFDVDGADFLKWQRGFGGTYDANDLTDWETNFGNVLPAVAATVTVPEPTSLALLSLGGLLALRRSRCKAAFIA